MEHTYINIMNLNTSVRGYYLLQDAQTRTTKSNKDFLSVNLRDASGTIEGVQWDLTGVAGPVEAGTVAYVEGTVTEYNGRLQVTLQHIRKAYPCEEETAYSVEQLVPVAPINVEATFDWIVAVIDDMEDEDYRVLCEQMVYQNEKAFKEIPAAKSVHHSFRSGLLMHTANMVELAMSVSDMYGVFINRDLLLAGTILHDLGKVREFKLSPYGLVEDYTTEGTLLGHLQIGAMEIAKMARNVAVPQEKVMLLQHLILSHHGKPEFGAAVEPRCIEAEILACIDMIDSRAQIYTENIIKLNTGEFSPKIYSLGKRIYNH